MSTTRETKSKSRGPDAPTARGAEGGTRKSASRQSPIPAAESSPGNGPHLNDLVVRLQELEDEMGHLREELRRGSRSSSTGLDGGGEESLSSGIDLGSGPVRTKEEMYRKGNVILNQAMKRRLEPYFKRLSERHGIEVSIPQVFGDRHVKDLFVMFLADLVTMATQPGGDGSYGPANVPLPEGYGSVKRVAAPASKKRTPQGKEINVPARWKLRFDFGSAVTKALADLPAPVGGETIVGA